MEKQEYVIKIYDKTHNIIESSHKITADKELIRLVYDYAIQHGYTFSSSKVKK